MRKLSLVLSLLVCSAISFAQTATGTITGTVSDPAGAVVANAPMDLKNTETGTIQQQQSSSTGNFTFANLPVGNYELSIVVPGFKSYTRQNLGVQATQTIRIDVSLEVGSSAESITVTDQASLLRTESAAIATNVTVARLNSLPILGIGVGSASPAGVRNPLASSILTPGVFFNPAQATRVNGSPANTYGIKLDGQDITNGVNTSASQQQVQPSVEALEEVAVQSSNYSAEFGQAGSGLFQYTTRSGTNGFHGSAYDYFVNEALNAYQSLPTANNLRIRNRARRNDFGGSIGGPVWIPKIYNGKDRTFFFFNMEVFKESARISDQTRTVPTAAYRGGNFASSLTGRSFCSVTGGYTPCAAGATPARDGLGNPLLEGQVFDPLTETLASNGSRARLQFSGNQIPVTRFDQAAVKYQNLIPASINTQLINNYTGVFNSIRTTPIPSIKIDHNFNSKLKIGFYKSSTQTETPYATGFGGSEGFPDTLTATRGTYIYSRTWRGNLDYTVTPTMLMHFGVGYIVNDFSDKAPITNFDMAAVLGIKGGTVGPSNGARIPYFINMLGGQSTGGLSNTGPFAQVRNLLQRPTAQLSLNWVKGNHTYKFGGEWRIDGYIDNSFSNTSGQFQWSADQTANTFFQGQALGGLFSGHPYASLLLGRPNQVQISQPTKTRGGRYFWSWFAQDTWKVTRKLTLDYGIRWDIFSYPRENHGRSPAFSPTLANPNAGGHPGASIFEANCNCRFAQNYPWAYAPRLGVAYQINEKTVVRVGLGLSYSMSQGGGQGSAGANTPYPSQPYDAVMLLGQASGIPAATNWPNLTPGLFPTSATSVAGAGPAAVDQNYGRPSRLWQFNIGLQREIGRDFVVEASYVGNRGVWWRAGGLVDYNALQPSILKNAYGLDWSNPADRTILAAPVSSAAAGRFRALIPYAGFNQTQTVAQALRPFPQFTGLAVTGAPLGNTWYDALQMKATKRLSHGLDFTWTYTYSKELTNGANDNNGGGVINDLFNRAQNKQLSSFSRPHIMVFAANYTLPKWGFNGILDQVVKDWTLGAVLQYASGIPIQTPATLNNNNASTLLRGTWATRVPGQPLYLEDINCHCFDPARTKILNEAAWTNTPSGTWSPSSAFYNDFRYQRRPSELMSIGRIFRFTERTQLMIRAEFSNIFNRTLLTLSGDTTATGPFIAPSRTLGQTFTRDATGRYQNGFGTYNLTGTVNGERQGTLVARFTF
jgi:hypothetical protein